LLLSLWLPVPPPTHPPTTPHTLHRRTQDTFVITMSGAGRKSAYRKSVTEEVLNSFPEPDVAAGERVAQVVQSRGGNILQVRGCGGDGWDEALMLCVVVGVVGLQSWSVA